MALKESNKNRSKRVTETVVADVVTAVVPPVNTANQWKLYSPSVFVPAVLFFMLAAILFI